MKQKYDNDYTWLLQHTRKHLNLNNYDGNVMSKEAAPKVGLNQDQHNLGIQYGHGYDGINLDSDVIVSEYRLLYLRYKEQIQ